MTDTVAKADPVSPRPETDSLCRPLRSSRIPGLDFLRAVAVLLVLADHSGLYYVGPVALFDGGFGVEMFFVISGFLITWLLLDEIEATGTIRLPAFYQRRAARLLPAFYAYLFGGLAVLLLLHKPVPWGAIGAAALYVVNYYQAFTGAPAHYLSHCWSLAVEEQFYLIWPIVLTLAMRRRWPLMPLLIGTIVCVWLLRLLLIFDFGASDEYLYRALETRADQLASGCLLAVLLRQASWREFFDRLAQKWWSVPLIIAALLTSLNLLHGAMESKYAFAYALEPVLVMILILGDIGGQPFRLVVPGAQCIAHGRRRTDFLWHLSVPSVRDPSGKECTGTPLGSDFLVDSHLDARCRTYRLCVFPLLRATASPALEGQSKTHLRHRFIQRATMRKIAIVTPMLPVPYDLTRGRYIHETARSLAKLAHVRVFFMQQAYPRLPGLRPRSFLSGRVGPDYRLADIDVEAFSYPAIPGLSRVLNGFVASRVLTPRLRSFEPDLVLAYWVYPDGAASLHSARALGLPCVVGALGSDIHVRSGFNRLMTRRTIAGVDALVTVSAAMRQTAITDFGAAPDKVHTIINGYNTAVFHPRPQSALRARLAIAADTRLIVYVGRFVEAKGMRELLAAFQSLSAADPRVRLALVGDGVMRQELIDLVRAANLTERVSMPGGLMPDQVAEWMCAADVLTLPSWSEGYPNVVVEAIACGCPVVATDVGGTGEIVNATNGILIRPRDPLALREALETALTSSWDRAAMAASMQRTWDDVAAETLGVCERVLPRAVGTPERKR